MGGDEKIGVLEIKVIENVQEERKVKIVEIGINCRKEQEIIISAGWIKKTSNKFRVI